MRTISVAAALLVCGVLARAQEAPTAENWNTGEISLGLFQSDEDTLSSKWLEYRDIPDGITAPYVRFRGDKNGLRYDFVGSWIQQTDQQYRLRLGTDFFRIDGDYNQIPHRFGNNGKTLLQETQEGVWQLSDTLQQSFQDALTSIPRTQVTFGFLNGLVTPSLAAANPVDLALKRERGRLAFRLTPDKSYDVTVTYFSERRVGDRAASGTSFGFGNVVELPETLHYLTQDIGADAQYEGHWGVLRGGLHYNWFNNRIETFAWDNPFRATDSTDASAYLGPSSSSISGPARGLMALPPDNNALTGTVGATLKLPSRTRLAADLTFGRWEQNSSPFIAYTVNTAITPDSVPASPPGLNPADVASLPARQLDGKINTRSVAATFSSHPADRISINARYRFYDMGNDTTRLSFPGYVRFDGVWEDIARISVPYGFKNHRLDATASYDFGPVTVEGGYRYTKMDRTFRETEDTAENLLVMAVNWRAGGWAILRGSFETGSRDFGGLELERSEDASFQEPGAPANVLAASSGVCPTGQICNLRFDQAKKDVDRLAINLQMTPGAGKTTIVLSYLGNKDDYKDTVYGLTEAKYDTFSAEVDYSPNDRTSLYGFYTYEKNRNDQRGRQSGSAVSTNPLDDWTSNVKDTGNSLGAGASVTLSPDKWFLEVSGRHQNLNGNNDLFAPPGGMPFNARIAVGGVQDIPLYDDTKLTTLSAEVRYHLAKSWTFAVGGAFEDYEIRDSNTAGLNNYVPGSFFLAAADGDYQAKWGYVRMSYTW